MGPRKHGLGELELEVLKTVWELPGCTVQEVAEVLGEQRGCARTTVLTVMQRLHAKGFLDRHRPDGIYRYTATEGRGKVLTGLIGKFVDRVLDGSPAPFLAYLAETEQLTDEQAAQLREMVQDLERCEGEQ